MKEITLINGMKVKVSDCDYELVSKYRWYIETPDRGNVYARAFINGKMTKMHRLIMGVTKSNVYVDHINHDGLDNRRENLRLCTVSQNSMNRKCGFGTSKFIGVCKHPFSNYYRAYVTINKKQINLGYFKDEVQAAKVRDEAAREAYGEFATLNFKNE